MDLFLSQTNSQEISLRKSVSRCNSSTAAGYYASFKCYIHGFSIEKQIAENVYAIVSHQSGLEQTEKRIEENVCIKNVTHQYGEWRKMFM
jgi:hypothetical protein